ncbi:MAG: DUF1294 domain-containing protein [Clostridia bacterium]|nr:DUF1294 domain-containing protein [Clostridia bacterium]
MNSVLIYLVIISVFSVIITVYDKKAAKYAKGNRIPESMLFFVSAAGGSALMFITMQIIRHKTRHKRFMIGLPIMMIIQCLIILYIIAK